MRKILFILTIYILVLPNLLFAQIIEIGKCYVSKEANRTKITKDFWNIEDYERSNTLYAKIYDKPFKEDNNRYWRVWGGDVLFSNEKIKDFKKDGYMGLKRYDKSIISINLSNNTISELTVFSKDILDFYSEIYFALKALKNKFPNKWTNDDQQNLNLWLEVSKEEMKVRKFKIEEYVGGIFIGRQLNQLHLSYGQAIKVDLDKLTYTKNWYDKINNRDSAHIYHCTDNYKNINSGKKSSKKGGNSSIKKLLKKLY